MSKRAFLAPLLLALSVTVLPGDLSAQSVNSPAPPATGVTQESRPTGSTPPPLALKGVLAPQTVVPLLPRSLPDALKSFNRTATRLEAASQALQSAYQTFIRGVAALDATTEPAAPCGNDTVAAAYADLRKAWNAYRKQTRLTTDCYRGIDAFHKGGYGQIVPPDVQADLEAAVQTYDRMAREHLAWRALMRKQVATDAERLNCPYLEVPSVPETLPLAERPSRLDDMRPSSAEHVANPSEAPSSGVEPSGLEVPVVRIVTATPAPEEGVANRIGAASSRPVDSLFFPQPGKPDPRQSSPIATSPAVSETPSPDQQATPTPHPPDPEATVSPSMTPPATSALKSSPTPTAQDSASPTPSPGGAAIRFAVDNSGCDHEVVVFLDGRRIGAVPAGMSAEFEGTEGEHTLCAAPGSDTDACSRSAQGIEAILYDGFALRPGC